MGQQSNNTASCGESMQRQRRPQRGRGRGVLTSARLLLLFVGAASAADLCAETQLPAPAVTTVRIAPNDTDAAWVLGSDCSLVIVGETEDDAEPRYAFTELGVARVESVPLRARRVDLDNNYALTAADFSNNTRLVHIILAWIGLEYIDEFKFPGSLQELDFDNNKLKGIPAGALPDGVTTLYLSSNDIDSLSNFSLPSSLITLSLRSDYFTSVNFQIPNGLQTLNMTANDQLKSIENFTMPSSLKSFLCQDCRTTRFRGVQLSSALEELNLVSKPLTDFEIRESDVEIMQSVDFSGTVDQPTCADSTAKSQIVGNMTLCVITDARFEEKYADRLQPSGQMRESTAPSTADPSTTDTPSASTFSPSSSSSSSSSTVVIVVAVIGGLVFLALAVIAYRLTCGAKKKNDTTEDKYEDASTLEMQGSSAMTNGSGSIFFSQEYLPNDIRNDEALMAYRIAHDEIQILRVVAKGGFGIIHLGNVRGREVAVKRILAEKAKEIDVIKSFMDEIRLCAQLEHPRIVQFIGVSWTTLLDLAVVIEFMAGGDLCAALRSPQQSEDPAEWFAGSGGLKAKSLIALDIVDAIVYLHSFEPPIMHRDLKARNVLINAEGDAKLSDFGISREVMLDETMTGEVGTVAWIAPEVLRGERYSEKADIYSLGVLLVELDTAKHPYRRELFDSEATPQTNTRIALLVSSGRLVPALSPDCPPAIQALVSLCLSFDPQMRPPAMDIHYGMRKVLDHFMGDLSNSG